MHIPDGYLSPQTYVPLWGVMVLVWGKASSAVRKTLSAERLPLLAIGGAYSFVIMMFNVPVPGGTTGHAVGAGLVTILLGPWAASIAISIALVVQALIFGDGGVTAIAANCFTMAVVGPAVAWWVYRAIARGSDIGARRRTWAGAAAAYAGLNASALATAVLFGIQPAIAHTPAGQPLYAPYPLAVAVPAMMIGHLLLFGLVEAVVTALALRWFQANEPALLVAPGEPPSESSDPARAVSSPRRRLWIALAVLAILSPLGVWLPSALGAGPAWGEWGSRELAKTLGFVPRGLASLQSAWKAILPDYTLPGLTGPAGGAVAYAVAAALGIGLTAVLGWLLAKVMRRPRDRSPGGGRRDYVGASLERIGRKLRRAMAQERTARADGWLQRMDPRVKLASGLVLIVASTLVRDIRPLVVLYLGTLLAAATSGVRVGATLRRVWLVVPLFAGVVLAPAALNLVTPGTSVLVLAHLAPGARLGPWVLPAYIAVTRQGLDAAMLVLGRATVAVAVVALVTATTRWQQILASLGRLGVPPAFVMVAEMMYRYFFVLAGLAEEDFLARRSRTIAEPGGAEGRRFVASRVALLFRRSRKLSGDVHLAMVSRGYSGEVRVLGPEPRGAGSRT
jgi:cobalt/nickel transport system permease protein